MKVIVTGGAGFIGSHLVDRLVSAGEEVIVIDLLLNKKNSISNHVKNKDVVLIKCDILKIESVKKELEGADMVFHLAAASDVRIGIEKPLYMFEQNVTATVKLLETMEECNINDIAFFSSQAVYGKCERNRH